MPVPAPTPQGVAACAIAASLSAHFAASSGHALEASRADDVAASRWDEFAAFGGLPPGIALRAGVARCALNGGRTLRPEIEIGEAIDAVGFVGCQPDQEALSAIESALGELGYRTDGRARVGRSKRTWRLRR